MRRLLPFFSDLADPDRITRTGYDAAGQVTQVQVGYNTADQANEVTATYTDNGKLKTVTDAEGNLTRYDYDGHDRLGYTVFPSKTVDGQADNSDYERTVYDANGNVTLVDLRDRKTISFAYDALNRVTDKIRQYPESDVAFAYDNLGRMTSASQPFNTLTFTYDALGRKLTEVGPHGTVRSEYDLAGNRTSLTWPDNAWVSYQHLVTGETEVIRQSGTTELARFGFDNLGRRTSLTRGNGTVTDYTYDGVSRLSQLTQDLAGTSHDLTLGFTYNPASQIKTSTRSNDAYAFTALVNGTVNSTVNGQNQLLTHGGATIAHDARGNITSDGTTTYAYNSENMLTSASNGAAFGYDPVNRLYSLTEAGGTRLVYDDLDMIAEYTPGGLVRRRYVHGPGVDEPIVWYEGADLTDPRYLHADERGSIVATSYPDGSIRTVQAYGEFGTPQNTSLTQTGRFGYTGQAWLPEVGLYNYKARVYGPKLGRFLQTDPIGYGDGINLYSPMGADPVNRTDPSGMCYRQTYAIFDYTLNAAGGYDRNLRPGSEFDVSFGCDQASNNPVDTSGGGEIVVTGHRPGRPQVTLLTESTPPTILAAAGVIYKGPSFCPDPTVGRSNRWNPFGKIDSGKVGSFDQALRDIDRLARLNRISPLGEQMAMIVVGASHSMIPFPVGGGWWASRNFMTGYFSFTNRGFGFRYHPETGAVRVDIPGGARLPGGGRLSQNETCHYHTR